MKINQRSVGIVVYCKKNERIQYLLLHHGGKYWNFPKGKCESGETEMETAFRELEEETGIQKELLFLERGFRESYRYTFRVEEGKIIYKEAVFYLGKVESTQILLSHEHENFGWYAYGEARKKLFFKNSQNVLRGAQRFLLSRRSIEKKKVL